MKQQDIIYIWNKPETIVKNIIISKEQMMPFNLYHGIQNKRGIDSWAFIILEPQFLRERFRALMR